MFRKLNLERAKQRLTEEQIFEQVFDEYEAGDIRKGLMARAISASAGDEGMIKGEYIKLRAQSIIDELDIAADIFDRMQNDAIAKAKADAAVEEFVASIDSKREGAISHNFFIILLFVIGLLYAIHTLITNAT